VLTGKGGERGSGGSEFYKVIERKGICLRRNQSTTATQLVFNLKYTSLQAMRVGRGADMSLTGVQPLWDKILSQNLQADADQGCPFEGPFPCKRQIIGGYTVYLTAEQDSYKVIQTEIDDHVIQLTSLSSGLLFLAKRTFGCTNG
jgi:hypothetical protein